MQYKLLALDIDGTLVNSEGKITPRVKQAIRQAVDAGCHVMLATGRFYRGMIKIQEELGLTVPCMVYGGAQIVDNGKRLYEVSIDPETTYECMQWANEMGLYVQTYEGDNYFFEKHTPYSDLYAKGIGIEGEEMPGMTSRKDLASPKILGIDEPDRIRELQDIAREKFAGRLQVAISKPRYLEITNPKVNKGIALVFLCKHYGLKPENCIAMGDGTIDAPMIEYAGLGVAMENADDMTKSVANLICPSNDEDGVAYIIDKYILGGETA